MGLIGKFKEVANAINVGKKIVGEVVQIKDAILSHNSDEKFVIARTEQEYENMKTQGKVDVLFLPGPEQKDHVQIKAYLAAAWRLSVNLIQAAAAKLKD